MAQDFYENWKKSATGRKVLLTWVRDPEGLLTGNGHFEGVYEFRFVNDTLHLDLSAYIGQAGNDKTAPAYVLFSTLNDASFFTLNGAISA